MNMQADGWRLEPGSPSSSNVGQAIGGGLFATHIFHRSKHRLVLVRIGMLIGIYLPTSAFSQTPFQRSELSKQAMPPFSMPVVDEGSLFDGNWTWTSSCSIRMTPMEYNSCRSGRSNSFALVNLTVTGGRICADHYATGSLQRKVDEDDGAPTDPSIFGVINGNVAIVHFRTSWTRNYGMASLTLFDDNLIWHVIDPPNGESLFPNDAVLMRDKGPLRYKRVTCTN